MARTSAVRILEWGIPPEAPKPPTGWDAIRAELDRKVGRWANVGEFSQHTVGTVQRERLTAADGYEVRAIPTKTPGRLTLWVRRAILPEVEEGVEG